MKKISGGLSFAAGLFLLLAGCTGSGPKGPQGNMGSSGVSNINITVYDIQTVNNAWTLGTGYYYAVISDDAITDGNNMDVVVTWSSSGSASGPWQALPASNAYNHGDQITYNWTTGKVTFYYNFNTLSNVPAGVLFNVCVIPPAIAKKYPGVNFKDAAAAATVPEYQTALKAAKHVNVQATANNMVSTIK